MIGPGFKSSKTASSKTFTKPIFQAQEARMPECKTLDDAAHTFITYFEQLNTYNGKTWLLGCPVPCLQLKHSYTLSDYHQNNYIRFTNLNPLRPIL